MTSLTIKPRNVFQLFSGTVEGQCMGGCKKMLTADDKDHSFCNTCWDIMFVPKSSSPKKVSFKDDHAECLMKPPCDIRVFDELAPASDVSSNVCSEVEPIKKNKTPGPTSSSLVSI